MKWRNYEYDAVFKCTATGSVNCARVDKVLRRALGARVRDVRVAQQEASSQVCVGLQLHADVAGRIVDLGPTSNEQEAVREFRDFWGGASELRRFRNGEIRESVVWEHLQGDHVIEDIVRHVLRVHFASSLLVDSVWGFGYAELLVGPTSGTHRDFASVIEAFDELSRAIRNVRDLPLSIASVHATGAALRYASIVVPDGVRPSAPIDVVVKFESSGRWPEDLRALQRVKTALLLELGRALEQSHNNIRARVGLENEHNDVANAAFLQVTTATSSTASLTFDVRVSADREAQLLHRALQQGAGSLTATERTVAKEAQRIHDETFVARVKHTAALQRLCAAHPALSPSIRLVKRFFSSQLMSGALSEEAIELLVVKVFVDPEPLSPPGSMASGFVRTLRRVAKWDWPNEVMFVPMGEGTEQDELGGGNDAGTKEEAENSFRALRKQDPYMEHFTLVLGSTLDPSGIYWTERLRRPSRLAANRMTQLCRASRQVSEDDPKTCFIPDYSPYDVVIHVNQRHDPYSWQSGGDSRADAAMGPGYDPVGQFVHDLTMCYASVFMLFHDAAGGRAIGMLCHPRVREAHAFRPSMPYSTQPSGGRVQANVKAMLAEIERVGGKLISHIDVQNMDILS